MTETGGFRMSQGFDVLPPKSGNAYPIPCEEWDVLKSRASRIQNEPWVFQSVGSVLLGGTLTTFVTIILGSFDKPEQQRALVVAWAVVAVTLICGIVCLVFANQEREVQRQRASDIVTQMELIEHRYDRSDAPARPTVSQSTLTIASARYGAANSYADITSVIAKRVAASGLCLVADNVLAGDPCPGIVKELVVEYEYNGQRRTKAVKEGETLSIP